MQLMLANEMSVQTGSGSFGMNGLVILLLAVGAALTLALLGFFIYVFTRKQD